MLWCEGKGLSYREEAAVVNIDAGGERLACGHRVEDVLAQVSEGRGVDRDAHQQQCPHCQAALAEYDRLWTPIRELAAETVSPPDSMLRSALRLIRDTVEHPGYGLVDSPAGRTRISARVVVVTARQSAQAVPGVRVALSRHVTDRARDRDESVTSGREVDAVLDAEITAGVAGRSTAIEITMAADYGTDLQRLGEQVRAAVAARVRTLTDLEPVHVTVIIDDVLD